MRSAPLLMQTIFGAIEFSQTKFWFMVGSHIVTLINNILIEKVKYKVAIQNQLTKTTSIEAIVIIRNLLTQW